MTRCPDERKLLAALEGSLPPSEAARVRDHRAGCARCAAAARETEALLARARGLPAPEPAAGAEARIWNGIERELARRARSPRAAGYPVRLRIPAALGQPWMRVAAAGAALAVAAAILTRGPLAPRVGEPPALAEGPPADVAAILQLLRERDETPVAPDVGDELLESLFKGLEELEAGEFQDWGFGRWLESPEATESEVRKS